MTVDPAAQEPPSYEGMDETRLRHFLRLRDRQSLRSREYWVRAGEAALALLPGASNSTHPAHDLWLRVEMAKAPPMEIVQP